MFAACATAEPFLDFQNIRRFFISSVIIRVPEAQKRDGVTVADVNSCQWLTKVAHADARRKAETQSQCSENTIATHSDPTQT